MTLTTATVLPPAAAPTSGPAVHAVVLTSGGQFGLRALLDALVASSVRPDRVVVLDSSAQGPDGVAAVIASEQSPSFSPAHVPLDPGMPDRVAVAQWLATATDLGADDLVWILPAGSIPEPQTLGRLLAAHRRSPSVGLVGPKHVDASNPHRLRSVGINTTRSGRVVDDPPSGEPDQGQYDLRRDVLALPLAGLLATGTVLRELGGWEPSFGDLGGDLDLGWRAQLAGRRAILAPHARMRSVASIGLANATTGKHRRAARRVALARASWWSVPFLALWICVSSLASAVGLLLLKRPRAARDAFADLGSLNPFRVLLSRLRTRSRREVRHRDIASLFVPASSIVRANIDRAHEALIAPPTSADEDLTTEDDATPLVSRAAFHPGTLAVLATLAVVAAAGRDIGGGLLSRLGSGVTGGELITSRATSSSLWHAAFDGWQGTGLGGDGPASPSLAVLAVPTWIIEHLPGTGDLTSPAGAVVGILLVLTLPLAALSAYFSARVLTSSRIVRGAAALAWATTGAAGAAVAQGRLGAIVALVLLPAVLAGVVLLSRPGATATGAFATALGAAVLGAFAPPLLVVVVLVCLGVALCGRPGLRGLVLVPAFVGPLLLGPWLMDVVDDWALAATGPGLSQWGPSGADAISLALLSPGGDGSLPWWVGAVVIAAGLAGLLAVPSIRSVSTGAAGVAIASLGAVLASPHIDLASSAPTAGGPVTPWAGTFMLPLTLALLASAVVAVDRFRDRARGVAVAALGLVGLVAAGALGWFGFGDTLRTWSDPRPAVAVEQAATELANRSVFVTPGPSGAAYRIVGRETGSLARALPQSVANDAVVARDISRLLDGTRNDSGPRLALHGIGFVAVAQTAGEDVSRRLDSAQGLSRLASRDGFDVWRIAALGNAANRPVSPARLALLSGGDPSLVATTGEHGATETTVTARQGDLLTVAEPPAWAGHASVEVDGRALAAVADEARPTYALPAGTHHLTIDVETAHGWWRGLQGLALAIVAFLAIPFGSRASRRRR
ncbi:MAG: glycosyltransferase family A protein [Knoellia sp.]